MPGDWSPTGDWRLPSPAVGGSRPALLYFDEARRLLRQVVSGAIRHASSTIKVGGWSASSSRVPTTNNVRLPTWIVCPAFQFGTALSSFGG